MYVDVFAAELFRDNFLIVADAQRRNLFQVSDVTHTHSDSVVITSVMTTEVTCHSDVHKRNDYRLLTIVTPWLDVN